MESAEEWLNRFANLWLSNHREREVIHAQEPLDQRLGQLIREELRAGLSRESVKEQEEWLRRFTNLWLACERERDRARELEQKPSPLPEANGKEGYSDEILHEVGKGRVVIADSRLAHGALENGEARVGDDDLIIFDIDAEKVVKWWTASKGTGV